MARLLSGSNGFVGKAIRDSSKERIIALGRAAGSGPDYRQVDLVKPASVDDLITKLRGQSISQFIHAAAVTPWSLDPDYTQDLVMAEQVAKICLELNIPQLIFISGWNVYDPATPAPYIEETALAPNTDYGRSKVAVEKYLLGHLGTTKLVSLRLASIYGPGQLSAGLIPNLVKNALKTQTIQINAKTTKRDYIYIDDVVQVIAVLQSQSFDEHITLNIGGGRSASVLEVAEAVQHSCKQLFKTDVKLTFAKPLTESQPADNQLGIGAAKAHGLLQSPTSFTDGIKSYIQWAHDENIF